MATSAGQVLWDSLDDDGRKSQLIAMTRLAAERQAEIERLRAERDECRRLLREAVQAARRGGRGE